MTTPERDVYGVKEEGGRTVVERYRVEAAPEERVTESSSAEEAANLAFLLQEAYDRGRKDAMRQLADDDLVSPADIAKRLGVSGAAVSNWAKRYDTFPRTVVGKMRRWSEVKAWHNRRNA